MQSFTAIKGIIRQIFHICHRNRQNSVISLIFCFILLFFITSTIIILIIAAEEPGNGIICASGTHLVTLISLIRGIKICSHISCVLSCIEKFSCIYRGYSSRNHNIQTGVDPLQLFISNSFKFSSGTASPFIIFLYTILVFRQFIKGTRCCCTWYSAICTPCTKILYIIVINPRSIINTFIHIFLVFRCSSSCPLLSKVNTISVISSLTASILFCIILLHCSTVVRITLIKLIILWIIQERYFTRLIVIHNSQEIRCQTLVTYSFTCIIYFTVVFISCKIKRRISRHNISMEGQFITGRFKCIISNCKAIISN